MGKPQGIRSLILSKLKSLFRRKSEPQVNSLANPSNRKILADIPDIIFKIQFQEQAYFSAARELARAQEAIIATCQELQHAQHETQTPEIREISIPQYLIETRSQMFDELVYHYSPN